MKIQLDEGVEELTKGYPSDIGWDLKAYSVERKTKDVFLFNTGIRIEPTRGYYVEIVPRSSIIKSHFIMANSVGIIDPSYRGLIKIPFRYVGHNDFVVDVETNNGNIPLEEARAKSLIGTRIAQLIIRKLHDFPLNYVTKLSDTERNEGGFGSTGK